jgi:16S rRNA (cytidine1402-2'-O)-methyltransferase
LVDELRRAGVRITALPGANAVVTFLSQVAREGEDFFFAGFLPKASPQKLLEKYRHTDLVFYESPNRLLKTLELLDQRRVAVGRELTKVFEEVRVGPAREVAEFYRENVLKGEIVVMVFRGAACEPIDDKIAALQAKGFSAKDISVIVSTLYGVNKNDIYSKAIK